MNNERYVAQFNVAKLKAPAADLPDFLEEVARVNAVGDNAPGFIWRYEVADGHSLDYMVGDYIINLTVWASMDDLWNFTFSGDHLDMLRRRTDWFEPREMTNILWWVKGYERHDRSQMRARKVPTLYSPPTPEEAEARLCFFWEHGPSTIAFTWKTAENHKTVLAL